MNLIQSIIENKNSIAQVNCEDIKKELGNADQKTLMQFLKTFSDEEWIKSNMSLCEKVISVLPLNSERTYQEFMQIFIIQLSKLTPSQSDVELRHQFGQVLYLNNRPLSLFSMCQCGEQLSPKKSLLEVQIGTLKEIITSKNREFIKALLEDILKSDFKIHTYEILNTISRNGRKEDIQLTIQSIEQAEIDLDELLQGKIIEVLENALENKFHDATQYFIDYLEKRNILNAAMFADKENETIKFLLIRCGKNIDSIQMILELVDKEEAKLCLESCAGGLILNCLSETSDNLASLLDLLVKYDLPVSKIIRNTLNGDRMTPIDKAALDGKVEHTKLLIKHTKDDDLRVILTTPNYGCRTTLKHSRYYCGEHGCYPLICETLERLGIDKATMLKPTVVTIKLPVNKEDL